MKRKTGMIVLNYNDYETTRNYLNLIKEFGVLDLIVVVDNCSSDDSYNILLNEVGPKVKLIKAKNNGGYGAGNNLGIKFLIKELGSCNIVISNPDIEVTENTLKTLIKVLEDTARVGLVGPVIKEQGELNRGWKIPTPFDDFLLNLPVLSRKCFKNRLKYPQAMGEVTVVEAVSGCFFLMKSEIFEEINYFDEKMFLYYEENVLGSKLRSLGYISVVVNDAVINHNHSVSIDKNFSYLNKFKELKKSQMYFQRTYNGANVIQRILLRLGSSLTFLGLYFKALSRRKG